MAVNKALMSSASDEWNTPECVLKRVRKVGPIGLDPCSNANSIVGASKEIGKQADGLEWPWNDFGLVYVNPPYSEIGKWAAKCYLEACRFAEIVALVPARVDTHWFRHAWKSEAICFWYGRLKFLGGKHSAPFPSAVVYWGPNKYRFAEVFSDAGKIVFP